MLANIIVGITTGLLASIAFWLLQAKILRSKVRLCPTIAKYHLPDDKIPRYQLKYVNHRSRAATSVCFTVRFHIPDLVRPGSVEILRGLSTERPPLEGRKNVRHTVRPNQIEEDQLTRYLRYFSPEIASQLSPEASLDLETFLKYKPRSKVEVTVTAVDSFSGATGVDRVMLEVAEIVDGRFFEGCVCGHTGILHEAPREQPSEGDVPEEL